MAIPTELHEIPYSEYNVINELVHSHRRELGQKLRAIIAFGALKTEGSTYDIELLEVVDEWQGQSKMQFGSSLDLPMRGRLYLHFMSSVQFESANPPAEVSDVLTRVLQGYEVIYQVPAGYARERLSAITEAKKKEQGGLELTNPLSLRFMQAK